MIALQVCGGRAAALRHPRPIAAALGTGLLASVLNVLVLASILTEILSILGFIVAGGILGLVGAVVTPKKESLVSFEPSYFFARVAVAATFLLVVIGGIVTSSEAGLAVPDWPTSFEANMFLLPLSKMVSESDVYYEHAHRLFGALVGLTTVALCVFLWARDPRRWVRWFAAFTVVLVVAQGAMGGLRVVAADNEQNIENFWSLALRVSHGVSGQVFFATLAALAAFLSPRWRRPSGGRSRTVNAERKWTVILLVAAIGQLLLGALVRHISRDWLMPHIAGAIVVGGIAVLVAVRATTFYPGSPAVRGSGLPILFLVVTQWMLGFFALAVTGGEVREKSSGALQTVVTTLHQATGALILAAVTVHLVSVWRHLRPGEPAVSASST